MISEKKNEKLLSFHIEQKMVFDFLRYSFGRIKVISTVVEREYTPDITWQFALHIN